MSIASDHHLTGSLSRASDEAFADYWKHRNSMPAFASGDVMNLGMASPSIEFQSIPPTLPWALAAHSNGQAAADYQPQAGEVSLRDLIAQHENRRIGAPLYSAENVLIVPGALSGISQVLEFIRGSVAIFTPEYFNLASRRDGVRIERQGIRLECDDIMQCGKVIANAVALTNPNNPMGIYEHPEMLDALLADCKSRGRQLVIDETCDCFRTPRAADFAWPVRDPNLIRVNGVSKSLNLAGHRFGWILADASKIQLLAQSIPTRYGNVHLPASRAIGEYLASPNEADRKTLEGNYARMLSSREFAAQTIRAIPSLGPLAVAESSYYLTLKLQNASSGRHAANRLLTEYHLDVMPGEVFGITTPAIRLCVARPIAYLREALGRLGTFAGEVR